MPKVKISRSTTLNPKEAFSKIKTFLSDDPDLRKLDAHYKCQFNESELTGTAKGTRFQATLDVQIKGEGCDVTVTVDLPLMLTPFKGLVENTVGGKLKKLLG